MRYYVYILQSQKHCRHYIGHCNDIPARLARHNAGRVRATRTGAPWKVIYTEEFAARQDAYRREMQIKAFKGGEAFKKLINGV